MRIFKGVVVTVVAVALAVGLNAALTFALVPYGSKSEVMWHDYSDEKGIDTIVVGTSLVQRAIDPVALDKATGYHTFVMATPSQDLEESLVAIKTAYSDHKIRRVILGLSYDKLLEKNAPGPGRAYIYERNRTRGFSDALTTDFELLGQHDVASTQSSINAPFPWIENHVAPNAHAIAGNVKRKTDGTSLYKAAEKANKGWYYYGKGYGNYVKSMNYDSKQVVVYTENKNYQDHFRGERLETLSSICAYCKDRGIELVIIGVPMPDFYLMDYGDRYYDQMRQLTSLCESLRVEYYDMNLAKPGLFDAKRDMFADAEHMNEKGAAAFSKSMAKLFHARERDVDMSRYFRTQEEKKRSLDYISAVLITPKAVSGGVMIEGRALAGKDVRVEYQMLVKERGEKKWRIVRDYADAPSFLYPTSGHGVLKVRVNVREVGSRAEFEHFQKAKVMY